MSDTTRTNNSAGRSFHHITKGSPAETFIDEIIQALGVPYRYLPAFLDKPAQWYITNGWRVSYKETCRLTLSGVVTVGDSAKCVTLEIANVRSDESRVIISKLLTMLSSKLLSDSANCA